MAAPKGNEYNKRYKKKEERIALLEAWEKHRKAGYMASSFSECDMKTFKRVCKEHPKDLPPQKLAAIESAHNKLFEQIGMQAMMGKIANFNTTVWIFSMKNKCGWRDNPDTIVNVGEGGMIQVIPAELKDGPDNTD